MMAIISHDSKAKGCFYVLVSLWKKMCASCTTYHENKASNWIIEDVDSEKLSLAIKINVEWNNIRIQSYEYCWSPREYFFLMPTQYLSEEKRYGRKSKLFRGLWVYWFCNRNNIMATFAGKSNFREIGSMPRRVVCNNRELEKKFGVSVQNASLLKE